jgi:hypothetical protein
MWNFWFFQIILLNFVFLSKEIYFEGGGGYVLDLLDLNDQKN